MIILYKAILLGNPLEREGHDRADINLPGSQLQLLQDVANSVSSKDIKLGIVQLIIVWKHSYYSNCPCTIQCWSS